MVITKCEDVTKQGLYKTLWRLLRLRESLVLVLLDRYHKHRFISHPVSIKDLLKKQDCKIFEKVTSVYK